MLFNPTQGITHHIQVVVPDVSFPVQEQVVQLQVPKQLVHTMILNIYLKKCLMYNFEFSPYPFPPLSSFYIFFPIPYFFIPSQSEAEKLTVTDKRSLYNQLCFLATTLFIIQDFLCGFSRNKHSIIF